MGLRRGHDADFVFSKALFAQLPALLLRDDQRYAIALRRPSPCRIRRDKAKILFEAPPELLEKVVQVKLLTVRSCNGGLTEALAAYQRSDLLAIPPGRSPTRVLASGSS